MGQEIKENVQNEKDSTNFDLTGFFKNSEETSNSTESQAKNEITDSKKISEEIQSELSIRELHEDRIKLFISNPIERVKDTYSQGVQPHEFSNEEWKVYQECNDEAFYYRFFFKRLEMLQWCWIEKHHNPIYVVNFHFSRSPDGS